MATSIITSGHFSWRGDRDKDGHRTYILTHLVRSAVTDGPAAVMLTPGLPLVGSLWIVDSDFDLWAFCWPTMRVRPVTPGKPNTTWTVEQTFSTKPLNRCQDTTVEDPLLEPQRISGSTIKFGTDPDGPQTDKDGDEIQSISFEPVKGLQFDDDRPQVRIGQNVPLLQLPQITQMINTVNDDVLWGLASRTIKLSDISWTRKLFGICGYYYTRDFTFDINFDTFDVLWHERGNKLLRAGGDINDPADWEIAVDAKDDIDGDLLLTAAGGRATSATVATKLIQKYAESNFLVLGIPTVIGI